MPKLDFKKEYKELYAPPAKKVVTVTVPPMNFLMVDGEGDPNTAGKFRQAAEALFSLSYTLKFMIKKQKGGVDYGVPPLEGLWWTPSMKDFDMEHKDLWRWTLMIMQPEFILGNHLEQAVAEVKKKKGDILPPFRFERFDEGLSAQIMHIGPYAAEAPTVKKIHAHIIESGHALQGKHHEIYLNDPHRTAPEKMKTVIRQPMK